MSALRIVHVTAPAAFGGLESVVRGLAAGFGERGHEVHVVAVFDRSGERTPLPLAGLAGVVQHVLEVPRRRYDLERKLVKTLCRNVGAQIMHTHGYRADVVNGLAAHAVGCRSVTTVHGYTGGGRANRLYEWLQTRCYRRLDAVVAVSRKLHGQLVGSGVPAQRIHLIPNAWSPPAVALLARADARRALGLTADVPTIGWVGRLSPEKGADVLVEALPLLGAESWRVAFVGAGGEEEQLRVRATALGVAHRITWCGRIPDAARYYRAFDVFALSSRTEGTPIALFEAMAAGVPAVVTRVGGVPDVVTPDEAWLVDPESPTQLAAALDEAMAASDMAARRAAAARARLQTVFAAAPWLDRYESLYRELIDAAAARRSG